MSTDEFDLAESDAREVQEATCPHCTEQIGGESASSKGDGAWYHLECLLTTEERVQSAKYPVHRLSEPELRDFLVYAFGVYAKKHPASAQRYEATAMRVVDSADNYVRAEEETHGTETAEAYEQLELSVHEWRRILGR